MPQSGRYRPVHDNLNLCPLACASHATPGVPVPMESPTRATRDRPGLPEGARELVRVRPDVRHPAARSCPLRDDAQRGRAFEQSISETRARDVERELRARVTWLTWEFNPTTTPLRKSRPIPEIIDWKVIGVGASQPAPENVRRHRTPANMTEAQTIVVASSPRTGNVRKPARSLLRHGLNRAMVGKRSRD
jgi:hypothetical protein